MNAEKESSKKTSPKREQQRTPVLPLFLRETENVQVRPRQANSQQQSPSQVSTAASVNSAVLPVHGSNSAYTAGAELKYRELTTSLEKTGSTTHPEVQEKEKDYKSKLSISELREYNDSKTANVTQKKAESNAASTTSTNAANTNIVTDTTVLPKPATITVAEEKTVEANTATGEITLDKAESQQETEISVSQTASETPAFIELQSQINATAKAQQKHGPAAKASQDAQAAAPSPANERQSMAQAGQVNKMDAQKPGKFSAEDFEAQLRKKINGMRLPQNEEQADEFEKNNNIKEINQNAMADVKQQKNAASGSIANTTAEKPNTATQPVRGITKMPLPNHGKAPAVANAAKAMPVKREITSIEKPLEAETATIDEQMNANGVTDTMLANSNEPTFKRALEEKNKAKEQSKTATGQFRSSEAQQLNSTRSEAQAQAAAQISGMHASRKGRLDKVHANQNKTAAKDTEKRKEIADKINGIYNKSKTEVEAILKTLDTTVASKFEVGSKAAKAAFEKHVANKMYAYKRKRYGDANKNYGALAAAGLWLWDKAAGLPDEVNAFFVSGKKAYIDTMNIYIRQIAEYVTSQLNTAKSKIAGGKKAVQDYVSSLSPSLRKLGQAAISEIQSKFNALEQDVDNKKDALIDVLAKKYADNIAAIDTRIKELKEQNKGLVGMALSALSGVFAFIIEVKNTLTNLLAKIVQVVGAIIADPIGFFGLLIEGVTQGFTNFVTNIWTHLKTGFFGWLTGAMPGISITMPEDVFSIKGIFSISMQVLGIGWDAIRAIGAKVVGEPLMKVLETGVEVVQVVRRDGVAGLWEYLKDQFQDLKETVVDTIMDIIQSQVIQAGIKWILGLLSPVGAFVKAVMAIIDAVKFFIQRAAQIIELVNAFIESVAAIASGKVSAVAKAIENALARAVPVLIGFLASLLGISGLADKVLAVIKKIRQRIVTGITKFWNYVKDKGKAVWDKVKTSGIGQKAGDLYEKGREKIQDVYDYFMGAINFRSADGGQHKIYPNGKDEPKNIMLASTPRPIEMQLDSEISISREQGDTDNVQKLEEAKKYYRENVKSKISELELIQKNELNSRRDADGSNKTARTKAKSLAGERDANFIFLKGLLEQITFSHGEKVNVNTVITNSGNGGAGDYVEALPLTHTAKGKSPGSANPPGWSHAKKLNSQGGGIIYVRGHMVNEDLGGSNDPWNLKPISNRMNREMEQRIESHAKREKNQEHKILYYRATVDEYFPGDKDEEGAFPSRLTIEWGHLMKNGKFDATGDKKPIQKDEFKQSSPVAQSISINELGQTLLVRALYKEGISEQFTKEVIIYLKNKTARKRLDNFDEFNLLYEKEIKNTKKENKDYFYKIFILNIKSKINF